MCNLKGIKIYIYIYIHRTSNDIICRAKLYAKTKPQKINVWSCAGLVTPLPEHFRNPFQYGSIHTRHRFLCLDSHLSWLSERLPSLQPADVPHYFHVDVRNLTIIQFDVPVYKHILASSPCLGLCFLHNWQNLVFFSGLHCIGEPGMCGLP